MKPTDIITLHSIWLSIKARCLNPENKQYKNYGGRGISLCKDWLDFNKFVEDVGIRPSKDLEFDRRDNDQGYFKENCRWISRTENMRNTRKNVYYETHLGKMCRSALIEKLGFTRRQFQRYVERHGIENLLERFKNNDIPKKHILSDPERFIGKKIGNLEILSLDRTSKGRYSYISKCDCGNIFKINAISIEGSRKRKHFCCKSCNKKGDLNSKRRTGITHNN
jgi:hypothetical protein